MFGMEKKSKNYFEFDLEKELKSNSKKKVALLKEVEEKLSKAKTQLKSTSDKKELEQLGHIVQGYTALERVVKRI